VARSLASTRATTLSVLHALAIKIWRPGVTGVPGHYTELLI
jgi:hypothetical protein